jgi:ATP-dependent 26S proteasome regulatory subunit
MDQDQIASLERAFQATPGNVHLAALLIDAYTAADDYAAAARVAQAATAAGASPDAAQRRRLARGARENGEPAQALEWLADSAAPEDGLERAHALLALGRPEDAQKAYAAAVAANSTLQDALLDAQFRGKVVSLDAARRGLERVVANDDTDATEVVRLLKPELERVKFDDVGGLDEVKKLIRRRIITPFQKPSLFDRFRRRAGGGILMYGPPGCGKTLLARATAGECGAKFFNVAIEDILDMYIGESERKLHAMFAEARRQAPAVMFFDEIEALGGKREYTREATSSKLVSQFLSELDGFAQNNQGVLILGATNVPWAIDSAFRRPGRFDRVLFVPPPDRPARKDILDKLLHDRPLAQPIDTVSLARRTSGFSGADLRHLVESAIDEAIDDSLAANNEQPLTPQHVEAALKETKPTTLEWLTTARNYARYANEGGQYDDVLEFLKKHGRDA